MSIKPIYTVNASGEYKTFWPGQNGYDEAIDQNWDACERATSKWTWAHWTMVLSGTAFFVSNIMLIQCGSSQCYSKPSEDEKQWCESTCILPLQIAVEIISGLGTVVGCAFVCK